MTYNERIKRCIRDDRSLKTTIGSLHNIVLGQCSRLMRNKVMMAKEYKVIEKDGDVTELLKKIRRVSL